MKKGLGLWILGCIACGASLLHASDLDEFKAKREEVFEFVEKPKVTRAGDRIEAVFESKGYCDATVAVENEQGKIIRHLASGVLGPNAPEPFQKNNLRQTVLWDGKDDQGTYLDHKDSLLIRVSLGLQPRFEKTLYWSPYKRIGEASPLMQADPSGILVYDGWGLDHIRLFDRDGRYVRTVYPFPADKLAQVKGLDWYDFPHGLRLPLKKGLYQQTLFTSGDNCSLDDKTAAMEGTGATAMGVRDGHVAVAKLRLNRLAADGSSGGSEFPGAKACVTLKSMYIMDRGWNQIIEAAPTSAALSPDRKWVYLAGYSWRYAYNFDTLHAVLRMPFDGNAEAKVFAGTVAVMKDNSGYITGAGSNPGEFKNATSVDCDAQGRVYVSDYMNDRIQVFSPEGKHLKSIPASKPAVVRVHRRSNELYVFSWPVPSRLAEGTTPPLQIQPSLTRLGTFDDPKRLASYELPAPKWGGRYGTYTGLESPLFYTGEIDSWSDTLTVWFGRESIHNLDRGVHPGNGGTSGAWEDAGVKVLREKNGKLEVIHDFGKETVKEVTRARPPANVLQKFAFDPKTDKLYLHEGDSGHYKKSVHELMRIDVETGKFSFLEIPFTAQDIAFDLDGMLYLRTVDVIARYNPQTMREIPWDYGEELDAVGQVFGKYAPVISGLVMPSTFPVCAHTGGFGVTPKGHVIAACSYRFTGISRTTQMEEKLVMLGKPYSPRIYPGRVSNSTSCCIHVWNKHGQMIYEDAVPGIGQVDGVAMDRNDKIYTMATATRVLDGKKFMNEMSETLMKFTPGKGEVVAASGTAPVPLSAEHRPKRAAQLNNSAFSDAWANGAEWFYGGVGFAGFNPTRAGGGCACRFSRFCLDLFARSIAPEHYQFGVAVLDSSGNLILRIGRYGNVDSNGPQSKVPLGGDEVGIFHDCYTGTHTDRRIFISDTGNGRIVSVKLGYYAHETVRLKDVPDTAR